MSAIKKFKIINDENSSANTKSSIDKLATYFHRIANHAELFRVGMGFLTEVKKGVRNFAFSSVGDRQSQQKTILGVCCYFDQNVDYKIAIISDHLSQGLFGELFNLSTPESYSMSNGEDTVHYKSFHNHFDFIDYSEFSQFYGNHLYTKNFEAEVKKVLEGYDLVFWDVPDMATIKSNPHFHYRISQLYQSMTIIVSATETSGKEVEAAKKFFGDYNIKLNGVLFDATGLTDKTARKKILGIF